MYKPQLATLDSVVVVGDGRDSLGSSATGSYDPGRLYEDVDRDETPQIAIGLSIRRGRLALFTLAMLGLIVGLTIYLNLGLELSRFDAKSKNSTQQSKLLDDYNSYSGSITSAFGKPIAFFVAICTQVVVLRFMAETMTRPGSSFKVGVVTLAIGALIGYLITNGFNALNVQLRPLDVLAVVSASDLSVSADSYATANSTNVTNVVPESIAGNPLTNSLLRNLVRTQVPRRDTYCNSRWSFYDGAESLTETTMQLNFPQREWQDRLLSTALTPDKLRLVVNPTNKTANKGIRSSDLPMNASLAADLLVYSMFMGRWLFPWSNSWPFINATALRERYPLNQKAKEDITDSTSRMYGLLPMDSRDETATREFFLRESVPIATLLINGTFNTTTTDVSMEFSHVDISPTLTFDSVTLEFQVDPALFASTFSFDGNATRYTQISQYYQCGASSGKCMIAKPVYSPLSSELYDSPAQVFAHAMCGDQNGVETLASNLSLTSNTSYGLIQCQVKSNSSLLVVSVGKRLEADALTQNMTVNSTGVFPEYPGPGKAYGSDPQYAVATNLRKVYSYTVGRLAWKAVDLAAAFNATCDVKGSASSCQGLQLPLASVSPGSKQWLVAGLDALPLNLVRTPYYIEGRSPVKSTLVAVNEPRRPRNADSDGDPQSGDILLPHNVRNFTWDPQSWSQSSYCNGRTERNMQSILDNHYYMESSLQTAYTAATFFLFQNAVVKNAISLSTGGETLSFDGNRQQIAVWVSTPDINAWLTLGGCVLLVLGLLATMVKAMWLTPTEKDPLAKITQPEAIARVMLDEKQFPPLLLHRHVVDQKGDAGHSVIDHFAIGSLSLQPQPGHTKTSTAV